MADTLDLSGRYSRRVFLRRAGAIAGVGVIGGAVLAACGENRATSGAQAPATNIAQATVVPQATGAATSTATPRGNATGGTDVGAAGDFANLSVPKAITVNNKPAYITLLNGKVSVLSAVCTHQGCTVVWDSVDSEYKCPCHGSIYDATGINIDGPAPRPLAILPSKIENGRLVVTARG